MIDFEKYIPSESYTPFYAKTKWGVRIVEYDSRNQHYAYLDCTHPLQNMYCNSSYIESWEYCDPLKMQQLLFVENPCCKIKRQTQGEEILMSIKFTTKKRFISKILSLFK